MTKKFKNLDLLLSKFRLVLASGSPRRFSLLKETDINFRQIVPAIDEDNNANIAPFELATRLAEKKAEAVRHDIHEDEIALGCDTIVVLHNEILGKPSSRDEAVAMLSSLAGQKHTVCSAVALATPRGDMVSGYELTDVYFKDVPLIDIERYVETGEPLDKAGAYGIQDKGVFLVDRVRGNIDNVIGLPMTLLDELAGKLIENKGLYE